MSLIVVGVCCVDVSMLLLVVVRCVLFVVCWSIDLSVVVRCLLFVARCLLFFVRDLFVVFIVGCVLLFVDVRYLLFFVVVASLRTIRFLRTHASQVSSTYSRTFVTPATEKQTSGFWTKGKCSV